MSEYLRRGQVLVLSAFRWVTSAVAFLVNGFAVRGSKGFVGGASGSGDITEQVAHLSGHQHPDAFNGEGARSASSVMEPAFWRAVPTKLPPHVAYVELEQTIIAFIGEHGCECVMFEPKTDWEVLLTKAVQRKSKRLVIRKKRGENCYYA